MHASFRPFRPFRPLRPHRSSTASPLLGGAVVLLGALSACGGTVVFEEPGEGGGSGDGGSNAMVASSNRASAVVSGTNVGPGGPSGSTGSGCPDVAPFACSSDEPFCLSSSLVCDGYADCPDGSDEFDCTSPCGDDSFTCYDGSCIPSFYLCDGYDDCFDGEDESQELCGSIACGFDELACYDGSCIPDSWLCDGEADCGGGEDENEAICFDALICGYDELRAPDQELAYCLTRNCCAELDACMSAGAQACNECLDAGAGALCDDALSCWDDNCY